MTDVTGDLWVFAYGSLIWRPGFVHDEVRPARLWGWHRRLCVYSWHHRGTVETPGVVLGLDRGGSCRGVVYRVAAERRAETLAYLREREQVSPLEHLPSTIYREIFRPVRFEDGTGRSAETPGPLALTYVVDRRHPQYTGDIDEETLLGLVRGGRGVSGANPDYVVSTADHLAALGMHDATLERLAARLRTS
jgi:cation transport protein ChaC